MYDDYYDKYDSLRKKSEYELRDYLERCSHYEVYKIIKSFDNDPLSFSNYPYCSDDY